MILPTKHITPENSLIAVGAVLLAALSVPRTVSELWEDSRKARGVFTFERFVLGLDLLYALELVQLEHGLLRRVQS